MSVADELLQQALDCAYGYLNRRERTAAELWSHLERAGFEAAAREQAVNVLIEDGQLDDARFAQLFAQDKRVLEQWGNDRIKRGLRARGVTDELIDEALAQHATEPELERATALLYRRFPTPLRERRERERAFGVLVRKGYDPELAQDAVRAWSTGANSPDLR